MMAARKATTKGGLARDVQPDNHLAYLLARVHHQLQRAMDKSLQAEHVTPTQFYALAHIAESPGLSSADLARGLLTTPQAVATLIKRLAAAGLIERDEVAPGRAGTLRLTPTGMKRLKAAASVAIAAEAEALSVIPAADQRHLAAILQGLIGGLEQQPPRG
jgi:DNA-binding MarR family transcriptional regulator